MFQNEAGPSITEFENEQTLLLLDAIILMNIFSSPLF